MSARYVTDVLCPLLRAWESDYYAMFKSCFDASGTGKERACTFAGFAGEGKECDRMEDAWKETVEPIGEFHAMLFFKRHDDGTMADIYEGISVADAEKTVMALIDLLVASKLEPIGLALDSEAFRSLETDERRWMTATVVYGKDWPAQGAPQRPYFVPLMFSLNQANQFTPEGETMYVTFDLQLDNGMQAGEIRTYNQMLANGGKWGGKLAKSLVHSSSKQAVLLQAADLLAYILAWSVTTIPRDPVAIYAKQKLAVEREYVRVMDTAGIDVQLKGCPFRSTFWKDMTEPDWLEQMREQGLNVLASKGADGAYRTHYIKKEKVRVVQEIEAKPIVLETE